MKTKPTEVTQEHIDAWKKEHGTVYRITVKGEEIGDETEPDKVAYLKKPNRKTLSYASTVGQTDPFQFNEIIFNDCFLGGDKSILENDDDFLAASQQITELVKFKQTELEKL